MGAGYRRADLQALAQGKLDDAIALFQSGRYSNAYYLARYAVEIGLKACIAATIAVRNSQRWVKNDAFAVMAGLVPAIHVDVQGTGASGEARSVPAEPAPRTYGPPISRRRG